MTNSIESQKADILEQIVKVVSEDTNLTVPVYAGYPDTGESIGIEKQAGETIVSQDMLGYTVRSVTYEVIYKTTKNGLPTLNELAEFVSNRTNSEAGLVSDTDSFTVVGTPSTTLPIQQGVDDDFGYFSFDINVQIETPY